jgi:hypothetical protein
MMRFPFAWQAHFIALSCTDAMNDLLAIIQVWVENLARISLQTSLRICVIT